MPVFFFGILHVRHGDVAEIRDVTQVEAHGLPHEDVEWHLVDWLAVGIDVAERVDVRADVIGVAMKFVWNVIGSPGSPRLKALEDSWLRWVVMTGRWKSLCAGMLSSIRRLKSTTRCAMCLLP